MDNQEDILKRYYRGDSTIEEERKLRSAFREGKLAEDPVLGYGENASFFPEELESNIRREIHRVSEKRGKRMVYWATGSAATIILLISLQGVLPLAAPESVYLSDNVKRERFEEALRVVGKVLEEKKTVPEKVLYEDEHLIITKE